MTEQKEWLEVPALDQWMTGWDNYHKKLLERPVEKLKEFVFMNPAVQVVGEQLYNSAKGLKVLELACGDGRAACFLAKLGCDVYAIDALKSAIEITKKRAEAFEVSERINAEQKNIDGWELEPESFDVIIATQCLQYLFDRALPRLKEIADAIKPGGFVAYSGNILPHYETEPTMRFITEKELREIFDGWTFYSFGHDLRLLRPNDLRGYIWVSAQKPKDEKEEL
ncbi:MAG: class I SAM-dependent methyltransferase [Candidatus Heimdallarchaeota archaeon]|nr:class I SAM-dependent methyltransferase [Candidatus Heimdallarchaeota archaeon]